MPENNEPVALEPEENEATEEKGSKKRIIECPRCGRKIKNKPESIKAHDKYCKRKAAERALEVFDAIESPEPLEEKPDKKPDKEIKKIPAKKEVKPATIKPVNPVKPQVQRVNKNSLIPDLNMADIILFGGLIALGLIVIRVVLPGKPAEKASVEYQPQTQTTEQETANVRPIMPPYPYYR